MGGCEIIAGDINGTVTSFQQHDALWKINIAGESAKLSTLGLVGKKNVFISRTKSQLITCVYIERT